MRLSEDFGFRCTLTEFFNDGYQIMVSVRRGGEKVIFQRFTDLDGTVMLEKMEKRLATLYGIEEKVAEMKKERYSYNV